MAQLKYYDEASETWKPFIGVSDEMLDRANHTGTQTLATLSDLTDLHPVGEIYINKTNPANPSTYLPGQSGSTWTAITDRMIVGAGSTFSAGETGGSVDQTLTEAQMPEHDHDVTDPGHSHLAGNATTRATGGSSIRTTGDGNQPTSSEVTGISINNAGSGEAFSIMNPYVGAYVWERTA